MHHTAPLHISPHHMCTALCILTRSQHMLLYTHCSLHPLVMCHHIPFYVPHCSPSHIATSHVHCTLYPHMITAHTAIHILFSAPTCNVPSQHTVLCTTLLPFTYRHITCALHSESSHDNSTYCHTHTVLCTHL